MQLAVSLGPPLVPVLYPLTDSPSFTFWHSQHVHVQM